ncbi:hypothetical protein G9A89_016639 [Geosiphon pyriformis]|nr:hypothetical protein G9A89_016639 [Geosiphon pyriformis]
MENPTMYNYSGLNIKSINGNIENLSARSVSLEIEEAGNMTVSITEIQNELYASNNEGNYINLDIKAIQNLHTWEYMSWIFSSIQINLRQKLSDVSKLPVYKQY